MTTSPLTPKQKRILDFIHQTLEERGHAPTHREIAEHFGLWVRGAQKHLEALERKGYLQKRAGARALDVTHRSVGRNIPIVGAVAAGKPILAEENIEGTLTLDPAWAKWRDCFLLRVKGDSMTGAAILDGDLVLVKPQADAENGQIVVALLNDEATVKRLHKKNNTITLLPENPAYSPIPVKESDHARILGHVVGVFRLPK
jgi:repressor LexA